MRHLEFEGCHGKNDKEFLEFYEAYVLCISTEANKVSEANQVLSAEAIEAKTSKKTVSNAMIGVVLFIICALATTHFIWQKRLRNKTHLPLWQSDNFEDCVFDAFISYDQPDREIMETIYHRLIDDSQNLKPFEVAFNDKDFVPGETFLTFFKYVLHCK